MVDGSLGPCGPLAMGPLHCPLCIGLAVLSIFRVSAHALLLWRMGGPVTGARGQDQGEPQGLAQPQALAQPQGLAA